MIKKLGVCTASLLTFSTLTFAGTMGPVSTPAGLFVGLGGSYNSVKLDQKIDLVGVSNVFSGSTLVAFGTAVGPAVPFHNIQTTFAPDAQAGYFRNITGTDLFWGLKFAYKYLGVTFSDSNIIAPQAGSFTIVNPVPTVNSLTGHALIGSAQTELTHEMFLMPYIGQSFNNTSIYLGAGPAVFHSRSTFYNVTGYAAVNGIPSDITGSPVSLSSSEWLWGGGAQIGVSYNLDPTWVLDLNYTYLITSRDKTNYQVPFASTVLNFTDSGTMFGSNTQRITAQAVSLTVNKVFSL